MHSCFKTQKSIKRSNKRNHTILSTEAEETSDKIQYLFTTNSNHFSANWDERFLSLTKGVNTPTATTPQWGEPHSGQLGADHSVWRSWGRVEGGRQSREGRMATSAKWEKLADKHHIPHRVTPGSPPQGRGPSPGANPAPQGRVLSRGQAQGGPADAPASQRPGLKGLNPHVNPPSPGSAKVRLARHSLPTAPRKGHPKRASPC